MKTIYMDNSATTRIRPEVLEAMRGAFLDDYGNPSSMHHKGWEARRVLEQARYKVARVLGADDTSEIIFTSGGTESDNLAIMGTLNAQKKKGKHIVTSAIEHHAVLLVCKSLPSEMCDVTFVPVDEGGVIKADEFEKALRDDTVIASVMHANNETGVIQPIEELSGICRERGITFHTDAVQSAGKIPADANELGVDMMSISAHKFHGPRGVGALYVRKGTRLKKMAFGGHHERNLRPGTENVPGAVGLAEALERAARFREEWTNKVSALRDRLEKGILETVPECFVNGDVTRRLPHITNISFKYVEGEGIILSLDEKGICVSSGSACTSDTLDVSHVLAAMGVEVACAHGSIRFSLSDDITEKDVDFTIKTVGEVIEKLRKMSPLYNKK